jgi:hypothetical protein
MKDIVKLAGLFHNCRDALVHHRCQIGTKEKPLGIPYREEKNK